MQTTGLPGLGERHRERKSDVAGADDRNALVMRGCYRGAAAGGPR